MGPQLSVVVPVYNEQAAIGAVLEKWNRELSRLGIDFRIDVYNDGSKDNTLVVLNSIAQKRPRIVVHDKRNSGHGPTILQGYQQNSDCEWVFQTDSDDEMQPEHFEKLWKKREHHDFLLGHRLGQNQPLPRRIISLISRLTVWGLFGRGVLDVNVPYRLMRTEKLKPIFHALPQRTFAPNVIISGWVARKKLRILEVPVPHSARKTGTVSLQKWSLFKAAMRSFMQTLAFRWSGEMP